MKGLEYWAKKHSTQWPEGREREVAYTAYVDGFRAMRTHAIGFIKQFSHLEMVSRLIAAIGQAEVDENGKHKALEDE